MPSLQFTEQEYADMDSAQNRYDDEAYGRCQVDLNGMCDSLGTHTQLGVYKDIGVCRKCGYDFFELIPHSSCIQQADSRPNNQLAVLGVPVVRYYEAENLVHDNNIIEASEADSW